MGYNIWVVSDAFISSNVKYYGHSFYDLGNVGRVAHLGEYQAGEPMGTRSEIYLRSIHQYGKPGVASRDPGVSENEHGGRAS